MPHITCRLVTGGESRKTDTCASVHVGRGASFAGRDRDWVLDRRLLAVTTAFSSSAFGSGHDRIWVLDRRLLAVTTACSSSAFDSGHDRIFDLGVY